MSRWLTVRVSELAAPRKYAINGGPFGSKLVSRDYVDEGVPVIRGTNLSTDSMFSFENFVYVSEEKANELLANNAHPGDLVFTQRGTLGQVGLIPEDSEYKRFVISQSQMKLTVDRKKADPYFVYLYFRSPLTVQEIENRKITSGVPHINLGILKDFKVPLPKLSTQKGITSILSNYDDLIDNNNRRIALLEESVHRLYREWFVHLRFPGHERVTVRDGVPEGWEKKPVGDITSTIIDYRGKTPKKLGGEWVSTGITALSALNIKQERLVNLEKCKFVNRELYDKWMKEELHKGDVLMTSEAPLGELYYLNEDAEFCLSQRLYSIRANPSIIKPEILFCALASYEVQGEIDARKSGTTVFGIRQKELKKVPVMIPSKHLQAQVSSLLTPMLDQKTLLLSANDKLREARDRLLPRLMNGTLTP